VIDVYSRSVVGGALWKSLRTDLALDALDMGLWTRTRAGHDITRCHLVGLPYSPPGRTPHQCVTGRTRIVAVVVLRSRDMRVAGSGLEQPHPWLGLLWDRSACTRV